MYLTTNKCDGQGDCIRNCPSEAIRFVDNKAFSCMCCGACFEACPIGQNVMVVVFASSLAL